MDEISCSFEDSSCQELLSHELNITNETEKREIHHLLQQCLTSSSVRTDDLEPICNDILVVFTRIFGVEFADQIKECLIAVIGENGVCIAMYVVCISPSVLSIDLSHSDSFDICTV